MDISFSEGYRAVSLAYVKYGQTEMREQFASNVFSYFSNFGIDPYVGICFGKYSRILDFYHKSAKIASFHLSKIQKKMEEEGLICSFSTVLGKRFSTNSDDTNRKFAVNAYTFLKPIESTIDYSGILSLSAEVCRENSNVLIETYWNSSLYPLLVVTRGTNYRDILDIILRFRKSCETAVDGSSYITLRVDPTSYQPVEDEVKGKVPAIVFLKLTSVSNIDKIQTLLASVQPVCLSPAESLGWYDVCSYQLFDSLSKLYEYGKRLKNSSEGNIYFTSTMLLGGKIS